MISRKLKKSKKSPIHLLLVDDDPNVQRMISLFLREEPIHLDLASDGRIALHKLEENKYDVIISDMQMPLMSGLEFIDKMRSMKLKTPVIIISAYTESALPSKLADSPVFAVINKPFDSKLLKDLIVKAVKSK